MQSASIAKLRCLTCVSGDTLNPPHALQPSKWKLQDVWYSRLLLCFTGEKHTSPLCLNLQSRNVWKQARSIKYRFKCIPHKWNNSSQSQFLWGGSSSSLDCCCPGQRPGKLEMLQQGGFYPLAHTYNTSCKEPGHPPLPHPGFYPLNKTLGKNVFYQWGTLQCRNLHRVFSIWTAAQ